MNDDRGTRDARLRERFPNPSPAGHTMTLRSLALVAVLSTPALADSAFTDAGRHLAATAPLITQAHDALASCHSGRMQRLFDPQLERLETARRAFEAGRRGTDHLRRSLEDTRQAIERLPHSSDAYRTRLHDEYTRPLDTRVAPLLETYTAGLTEYARIITAYGAACATPSTSTTFVASITPAVDALEKASVTFGNAVGTPPPASDKPHLVARHHHAKKH